MGIGDLFRNIPGFQQGEAMVNGSIVMSAMMSEKADIAIMIESIVMIAMMMIASTDIAIAIMTTMTMMIASTDIAIAMMMMMNTNIDTALIVMMRTTIKINKYGVSSVADAILG